jgi:hypothetical protein
VHAYNVSSVLDVPCGDLAWMRELFRADIVGHLVDQHKRTFPEWKFLQMDYVQQEIMINSELIFNRAALQHLNVNDVFMVLHHFSLVHTSRFLLTTSYDDSVNNNLMFVNGASNTIIQLDKSPYFLDSIETFWDGEQPGGINSMKLFKLPLVRNPAKFGRKNGS